ncbi:MAG TPA: ABC transporter substrate-binding protein [Sphingomicrobium sp.]
MRSKLIALALILALAGGMAACRQEPEGTVKVLVIGGEPQLRDPASGPLSSSDSVLLSNVAQGLVRFDSGGNIVAGLAERWNVSDDGMSYIFRLAATAWPGGGKITAEQVARVLKRQIAARSRNPIKDTLGAVEDIVAMTDRVIEIRLAAPRPNLLPLLAQPEMAIIRGGYGTGPFSLSPAGGPGGELRLLSEVMAGDDDIARREEVLLSGESAEPAVRAFAAGKADLVLGGTFAGLPFARSIRLQRNSLRFDPASGLFGLVPASGGGLLDDRDVRRLLSQAIDRDALVAALNVPGLLARATVLEPGLDGVPDPVQPAWYGTSLADRRPVLLAEAKRLFGNENKPAIRVYLDQGPGADILFARLAADWGPLGLTVERARTPNTADVTLIDAVAPSTSPAWFLRNFRCGAVPLCDEDVDQLLGAARTAPVPAQRYALLYDAAGRIDDAQLFIPLAAPIRWSLVASRIQGFAGNRYARHTLTDLEQKPGREDQ